jgi:uncharacterized membrane protein
VTETLGAHAGVAPVTATSRAPATVGSRPLTATGALLVAIGAAVWTGCVGALAVARHNAFLSHRFDLGNMVQAVWSTSQGRPLDTTEAITGEQIVRLAVHVDPALVLYAPLWWIHPGPESLIVGQAAAVAAGLYPVVRLALKYTASRLCAALLGCWYLAFPWIVWSAFNDVHAVTLAIPCLLYAIWFLDQHHLGRFAVVAVLALSAGELVGLTVAALGVWYAVRYGRRRAGLAIALAGAAWTAICLTIVIPAFNDGQPSRYYSLFESTGGSPGGLLKTLVTDPGTVLAQVLTVSDGLYVLLLLIPTALLALGQPLLLATALPQLGVNSLSELGSTTEPTYQYVATIVPVLVAASIMAVGRFQGRLRLLVAATPLVAALMCLVAQPPAPGEQEFVFGPSESGARTSAMRAAVQLVPADAPVTTTNRLGAHLSARRKIFSFPERMGAEWAVLDLRDAWLVRGYRADEPRFREQVGRLDRDASWQLVFERADIRVYRRAS